MVESRISFISKTDSFAGLCLTKRYLLLYVITLGFCFTISSCQETGTKNGANQSLSALNSEETVETAGTSSDSVADFNDLSVKPVLIQKIEPVYPKEARKAGIEGMVIIKILVDTSGIVTDTEIIKSVPQLDEAAVDAARRFKFEPGQINGKAVKTRMTIPFQFKLRVKK